MSLSYVDKFSGIKKTHECSEVGEEHILQVKKMALIRDIPISMLSDEYFRKVCCFFHILHKVVQIFFNVILLLVIYSTKLSYTQKRICHKIVTLSTAFILING